ncbi:MAG: glycosyltransferase [Desulfobacterales bacterium]
MKFQDRIKDVCFNPTNEGLPGPTNHFWSRVDSELIGKVDNDTLVPPGWLERLVEAHQKIPKLAVVGGYHFQPEDFDDKSARSRLYVQNGIKILPDHHIGGCCYLMKKSIQETFGPMKFNPELKIHGWTEYQHMLADAGYIVGYLYPLIQLEYMDDPRSKKCLIDEKYQDYSRKIWRERGINFKSTDQVAEWLQRDAQRITNQPPLGTPSLKENSQQINQSYYGHARPEIQALVSRKAKRILDIGCGAGVLGKELKNRQKCYVAGIECASVAARKARKVLDRVYMGDATKIVPEIQENSFDTIIMADFLEHIADPEKILCEVKRILISKGRLVLSIPNVRHWSVIKDLLEGRWEYQDAGILDKTHLRFFTWQSILSLMNSVGYQIESYFGTYLQGYDVPVEFINNSTQCGIDTSSLANEGRVYQYLITCTPNSDCDSSKVMTQNQTASPNNFTSIIILTHNQLEYTKRCIKSIFYHTKENFELIVVDNGSTDGTVDYLESAVNVQNHKIRGEKSKVRINIIKNKENLGFAAGNNQGILTARGDYILLLNNDIVVTPGWLDRLIRCAEQDSAVGIVGPLSNYVSGQQLVKGVSYDTKTLTGLDEFAKDLAAANSGRKQRLIRVVGFCMLVKRAVIEKIGGMDSAYGLGNFEDDDFSLRAALAGFESWMVQDCFVHHFGSRTFIGEQIDYRESLQKNWEIFKRKWRLPAGLSYDSGYTLSLLGVTSFDPSIHYIPYQKAVKIEPPNPTFEKNLCKVAYLNRQGEDHLRKGDLEGALNAFKKALEIDPSNATTHNDLGVLYYNQGDKEEAFTYYRKAARLDPDNITFQKNLADFYYVEMGKVEEAMQIYVKALNANPKDIETLLVLGHICVALENFLDAKVFYSRVLEIEPGNQDALHFFDKVNSMNSSDARAKTPEELYRHVQSMLKNRDPYRAQVELERLLDHFPDFALAYNDLGVLYYNDGDKEKALNHYQKAVQLEPANATFQKNLADFYFVELDRKEDALQIYLGILNEHPNDLEINLTAAHICVALHDFDKAKTLYNQVLVIDPENEDARDNLNQLEVMKAERRTDQHSKTESPQESTPEGDSLAKEIIIVNDAPRKDLPQFSIIIPTSTTQKQIRTCVESIKLHTSESHEILFVNNGTTKGVTKWLQQCIDKNHNCRLLKCSKGANPAVCYNTGIKAARGEYIVLLSNDVVVTDGWLSAMLQCFNSIPSAGMVGTMANRAKGRQKVAAAANTSFKEVNAFAKTYRVANRYRRIGSDILDSFCLLFRRDLTKKIGWFDEQLGAQGFEDEDYCLRAALEGYANQIAGDVYLHRLKHKAPARSKKNFNLKWSGADVQSPTGKRHIAFRAVEKANTAAEEGRIDLAVELFLQAIGLLPEYKENYFKLAEMLINTKGFKDALDVLNELPKGDPDARHLALAACCKEGLELFEEAEGYANQALEISRCPTSALNTKGIIAFRRGDKNAAESYFARAIETDPGFGEAYTNIGALRWEAGLKDEALSLYERGFILSPTVPDIAFNYHCALSDLCEYKQAENVLRDAAAVHPCNKKIRYMLIDSLLHQQKHGMAMQEIEKAIADFGSDEGILSSALGIRENIGPLTIDGKTASGNTVSLCMIVKDEEEHLARCLQSVGPLVDEIIVVDTGSKDRSRDIAKVFGAKVYDFEWAEDFAEARNYSLSKATGKVVFVMDGDEVISPLDYELFRRTARQSSRQRSAFTINTRNYTMDNNLVEWVANEGYYDVEEAGTGWTPSAKIRLFPNDPHIRFDFPVHEMVEPSLQKLGIAMKFCKIQVHHYGKLNRDKSDKKGEAYYEIGCKKLEEMGDSPIALRELAIQAEGLKKHEEAVALWKRFIAIVPDEPKAYINLGISNCNLGQFDKVLASAEKALELAPDLKEAHFNRALASLHLGHPDQAIEILENLCHKMPEYLPARFILAAAWCCREDKKRGIALFKELSGTAIGPGLAIRVHELASRFVLLQRPDYALALLDAAIDSQNANKDVLDLYADCLKLTDLHKKTGTYE